MRILFVLLSLFFVSCSSGIDSDLVGKDSPPARIYMFDGQIKSLEDYKGREVIALFWATSCSHSYSELKSLVEEVNSERSLRRFAFIAVSVDKIEQETKLQQLINKLPKSRVEFAFSGNDLSDEFYLAMGVQALPTFVRVNRFGKIDKLAHDLSSVLD